MNKIWIVAIASAIVLSTHGLYAEEGVKADRVVDLSESIVSYDIKTVEGEDLLLTADYTQARPNPELENMDIVPQGLIKEGTKSFTIPTKENTPINIQYSFSGGERSGMKISAQPSNPTSDAEYSQILSVESKGGYTINFTFIWQGGDLKEVRIEPLANPFSANN